MGIDFTLRSWQLSDLGSLVKYADNPAIAANLTDAFPSPYTEDDGRKFIQTFSGEEPLRIFAIVINGEASGSIGIIPQTDVHRKNAEMGYWLAQPFWGNGIMVKVIGRVVEYGFKTWDIDRIFARPYGTNKASQRVLEKAGFRLEGRFEKALFKNGQYLDELIYALRRG